MIKLTQEEARSALWAKIKEGAEASLEAARMTNDYDLSEKDTHKLRGRIMALKEFLAIGEPDPDETADYGDAVPAQQEVI